MASTPTITTAKATSCCAKLRSPALTSLAVLVAYLVTGSFGNGRYSPVSVFIMALALAVLGAFPTSRNALISIALVIISTVYLALDHIHGECWYGVLTGGESWHRTRLGERLWFAQCQQSAVAFWVLIALGLLWVTSLVVDMSFAHCCAHKNKKGKIALEDGEEQP